MLSVKMQVRKTKYSIPCADYQTDFVLSTDQRIMSALLSDLLQQKALLCMDDWIKAYLKTF